MYFNYLVATTSIVSRIDVTVPGGKGPCRAYNDFFV